MSTVVLDKVNIHHHNFALIGGRDICFHGLLILQQAIGYGTDL